VAISARSRKSRSFGRNGVEQLAPVGGIAGKGAARRGAFEDAKAAPRKGKSSRFKALGCCPGPAKTSGRRPASRYFSVLVTDARSG
jgi:hypothetical protein